MLYAFCMFIVIISNAYCLKKKIPGCEKNIGQFKKLQILKIIIYLNK